MKKIKKILKDIWKFSKGNKTIFLQMVWLAIEAGLIPLTGGWLIFVRGIIALLTGGSLWDHYKKGYFTTKDIEVKEK